MGLLVQSVNRGLIDEIFERRTRNFLIQLAVKYWESRAVNQAQSVNRLFVFWGPNFLDRTIFSSKISSVSTPPLSLLWVDPLHHPHLTIPPPRQSLHGYLLPPTFPTCPISCRLACVVVVNHKFSTAARSLENTHRRSFHGVLCPSTPHHHQFSNPLFSFTPLSLSVRSLNLKL